MFATLQLFLALGFGPAALVADLVVTGAAVLTGILVVRARRPAAPAPAAVVSEAEAAIRDAEAHQPV